MSTSEQGVKNPCKAKKQVGKSLPVVVFTFGEAGAAKPCTQSCMETSKAGKLLDTRFADRWRCHNQTYLDNSDFTATKIMDEKKTQCDNQN